MINSNWHPISYRFGVIAAYCSNFGHCVFEPPFGGLETTYDVHLGLIGKHVVSGFPISVNWTFFATCYGWGATGEKRSKIVDFASTRSLWPKIHSWANECLTTLSLTVFTQRKRSVILDGNRPYCVFDPPPLWGLTSNVRLSSNAHWKACSELFSLCYGWGATSEYRFKIGDFAPTGTGWPNMVEGVAPTNSAFSQKTRLNVISYGIKIWTDLSFVLSQCTLLTNGQTNRILSEESMQCSKSGARYDKRYSLIGSRILPFDWYQHHWFWTTYYFSLSNAICWAQWRFTANIYDYYTEILEMENMRRFVHRRQY